MTAASFLVGFRIRGGIGRGLLALALIMLFSFTFEVVVRLLDRDPGRRR
jgi:hypothetical protein